MQLIGKNFLCHNVSDERGDEMMTVHIPSHVKDEIIRLASLYPDVEKVILFGSRARGDHDERSDVDLAIQGRDLSNRDWLELSMTIQDDLDSLLFFDVVKLEGAPGNLALRIQNEGEVLYERKKVQQSLDNLGRALNRLEKGVKQSPEDQLMIDGVIQRFEFTIELFWKTLKRMLETEGMQVTIPKASFKTSLSNRLD
jgi:predicted nucleotidyltransferase